MIANVNEKGRQTKLLAAIAVLAMVVCAFAVVMPSEEISGISYADEPADVTQYTKPIDGTGLTASQTIGYYVANSATGTDATFTLADASATGAVVNIYMAPGATISITTPATANVIVNLYVAGTYTESTGSGAEENTGTVLYYAETETTVAASQSTAAEITATDYGFSTKSETAITGLVEFTPTTDGATEFYNAEVVGNGKNSF